jgi:small-conductance mechanosensitive channel
MKELIVKMLVTFVEASVGSLIAISAMGIDITDKHAIVLAVAGIIGAGISAVWNKVIVPIINKIKTKYNLK